MRVKVDCSAAVLMVIDIADCEAQRVSLTQVKKAIPAREEGECLVAIQTVRQKFVAFLMQPSALHTFTLGSCHSCEF